MIGGPADPYARVYCWADLLLMWELGRSYIQPGLPEAIDDARTAAANVAPARSYEERVQDRLDEMAEYGRRRSAEDAAYRQRARIHYLTAIAAGAPRAEDRAAALKELDAIRQGEA